MNIHSSQQLIMQNMHIVFRFLAGSAARHQPIRRGNPLHRRIPGDRHPRLEG